jgi:hypothetical protein
MIVIGSRFYRQSKSHFDEEIDHYVKQVGGKLFL